MSLPKPYYQDEAVTIYHADCRGILPSIATVDLVLTDPPYRVGTDYGNGQKDVGDGFFMGEWMRGLQRYAPLVVFTPGYRNMFKYTEPEGLFIRFDRTAQSPSNVAWLNKWEPVFVYGSVPSRLNWDVIETATQTERLWEPPLNHPCPKSITLLRKLIDGLSSPGQLILDPFMGSGTTLRAAKDLGRKAIGIEIEEKYCEIAAQRMSQMVMPL